MFLPWITTCPNCDVPLDHGLEASLSAQPAPRVHLAETWIDIPISSDGPVQAALLKHFLTDHAFAFEESRRFISIPADEATRLAAAIEIWAFHPELPDDDRHVDTLAAILRDLGHQVLNAILSRNLIDRPKTPRLVDLR